MALAVCLRLLSYAFLLCSSISPCLATYYDVCDEVLKCGDFQFEYPFGIKNSGCGDPDFQVRCDKQGGYFLIEIGGDEYRILSNIYNNSMTIINNNLWPNKCNFSGNYSQFWLSTSRFHIVDTYTNLTIWGQCDQGCEYFLGKLSCDDDWSYNILGSDDGMQESCKTQLQLPIQKDPSQPPHINPKFPWRGFLVTWHVDPNRFQSCGACFNSLGRCGYDTQKPTTTFCLCPDGNSYSDKCPDNGNQDTEDGNISAIAAGCFIVGVAVTVIAVALVLFSVYDACKKRRNPPPPQILQGNGNAQTNPSFSSSAPESSLFASTEKSSSIENQV